MRFADIIENIRLRHAKLKPRTVIGNSATHRKLGCMKACKPVLALEHMMKQVSLKKHTAIHADIPPDEILENFGVAYFSRGTQALAEAREQDLYMYRAYIGPHRIMVEKGDSLFWLDEDKRMAHLQRGHFTLNSKHFAVIVRGYTARTKSCEIDDAMVLPYVNGSSTRQLFPPERLGDPTLQLLKLPPYSREQVHHIHSTTRVVYILEGKGRCIVGMDQQHTTQDLEAGMTLILHPMCPHHFETAETSLLVMPLHVFSSAPEGLEHNHPMFNGTHRAG